MIAKYEFWAPCGIFNKQSLKLLNSKTQILSYLYHNRDARFMANDYSNLSRKDLIAWIEAWERETKSFYVENILPKISALEDARLLRMFYPDSFMEDFEKRYQEGQKRKKKPSYEDIFYEMDYQWFQATGQHRYNDYMSFRTTFYRWKKSHAKKSAHAN